jgi:hypothetical protein
MKGGDSLKNPVMMSTAPPQFINSAIKKQFQ